MNPDYIIGWMYDGVEKNLKCTPRKEIGENRTNGDQTDLLGVGIMLISNFFLKLFVLRF